MSNKREKTIYLCLAHMSETGMEQKYVKEAFDTNWVVPLGPNVDAFEDEMKDFVGGECEVGALSSGTAAVHLALLACGVQAGDEVIVQSFTFCASSHPITYLGAKPVFVGSEPESWNMDPELLEVAIKDRIEKTGRKPKAIVPVALYGMPYDCERIMAIADKYGIPVVEDAAEGFGSRFDGRVLGTYGRFGVMSFNGNKMITTSGGGALICRDAKEKQTIMWYATQARDAYPYYQHTAIGYNYRMSNICAGIGRGQMTVAEEHIAHHKRVQGWYAKYLCGVDGEMESGLLRSRVIPGIALHVGPADARYDSNFWLCTATIDPEVKVAGQENAYKEVIKTAVGGATGVIKAVESATTDCQPNDNVEALRMFMLGKKVECRPVWKPMHCQPVYRGGEIQKYRWCGEVDVTEYANSVAYTRHVEEEIFKVGFCLPAGPWVTEEDVKYIVDCIKEATGVATDATDDDSCTERDSCAKHDANNVLIDKTVLDSVWEKAAESERKRMHFDLRTSQKDTSQRILNALLPGTVVPVHRHRDTAETILVVSGRLTVVLYDEDGRECARHDLNPKEGRYGLQVAKGQWHTVTVDEPCVIFEAMDGCFAPLPAEDVRSARNTRND